MSPHDTRPVNGANGTANKSSPIPGLWITGLAAQYPPYLLTPDDIDKFARRFYDVEKPGLKKLLAVNRTTGIASRSSVSRYESGFGTGPSPPSIADMDAFYRAKGVDLATQACLKALRDAGVAPAAVTHTVGHSVTSQGAAPGFDLAVARRLGLPPGVDRTLLHGVGCAGGLAAVRAAAQLALGATARGRPARVLGFACELCTALCRRELALAEAAAEGADINIAPVLFGDAAAAFVLCNELGLGDEGEDAAVFQLFEWGNTTIPDTQDEMGFFPEPSGQRTVLTREVPIVTKKAIGPMFEQVLPSFVEKIDKTDTILGAADFDWALHPGGIAIIDGVREAMSLTKEHLRASYEIYKTRGNSSSPTVLIVLDLLRSARMGQGRDNVVAASFGPGIGVEMAMLRRCRQEEDGDDV